MRHLINRETGHNTEPPTQDFELAKWHENRGHFEEALKCFKQSAMASVYVSNSSKADAERSAISWIEYGRINVRLNKYEEAAQSFKHALSFGKNHTLDVLVEWASLLYKKGLSDSEIFNQLRFEISAHSISPIILGRALNEIGAYKEAILCFNMAEYTDFQTGICHACCLINDGRHDEAMNLLVRLNHTYASTDWTWDEEAISLAMFLCKWRLSGSLPYLPASDHDRFKLAGVAISFGMLAEAEYILSTEGVIGEYALIHLLYSEGYIELADKRIKHQLPLPISYTQPYSAELAFIAAERLYDTGDYERASVLFESLRLSHPEHTSARFAEAACYLQSALLSLSTRLVQIDSPDMIKQQAMEYMESINAALHIVENTKWHTSWTPAQQRRECRISQTNLLN